jgi:hypothetical protein
MNRTANVEIKPSQGVHIKCTNAYRYSVLGIEAKYVNRASISANLTICLQYNARKLPPALLDSKLSISQSEE